MSIRFLNLGKIAKCYTREFHSQRIKSWNLIPDIYYPQKNEIQAVALLGIPTILQNIKNKVYQSVNICYADFSGTFLDCWKPYALSCLACFVCNCLCLPLFTIKISILMLLFRGQSYLHVLKNSTFPYRQIKGAVSRNSAKLGNYKIPVKLKET